MEIGISIAGVLITLFVGFFAIRTQLRKEIKEKLDSKLDKKEYDVKMEAIEKSIADKMSFLDDKFEETRANIEHIRRAVDMIIEKHYKP